MITLRLTLILSMALMLQGFKEEAPRSKEVAPEVVESMPESPWVHDLDTALAKAKAEKKMVIADFTGSDWCGWCIKLKKEVFDTEAFLKGIEGKYVLAEIDFPKDKSILSEEQLVKNQGYMERFKEHVKGFPTIIVFDGDGKILGQTGYQAGGPEKYLLHLIEIIQPDYKEKAKVAEEAMRKINEAFGLAQKEYEAKNYAEAAKQYVAIAALTEHKEGLQNVHYNAACCFALLGQAEEALKHFELSLKNGWADFEHISKDTDLDSLRENPKFKELIAKYSTKP